MEDVLMENFKKEDYFKLEIYNTTGNGKKIKFMEWGY